MTDISDTAPVIEKLVTEHYRAMTATQRCFAASSMFDTARAIVESSLPAGLTRTERRLAVARRLYGEDLPEAVLQAHANYQGS